MKKSLVEGGPLSVSFEVYNDFMMYKSGVYHHTGLIKLSDFEPFEVH
jgi:cathepsin C